MRSAGQSVAEIDTSGGAAQYRIDDQRELLRKWRIPFRQIGREDLHDGIYESAAAAGRDRVLRTLHGLRGERDRTSDKRRCALGAFAAAG